MPKNLKPCNHDYTYDEECNSCIYKELFESESVDDGDCLDDLHQLLEIEES